MDIQAPKTLDHSQPLTLAASNGTQLQRTHQI